jgi:hypothetical protein
MLVPTQNLSTDRVIIHHYGRPCDAAALLDRTSPAALTRMLYALLRARKWWSVICGSSTLGPNSGSQNLVRYLGVQQTCAGTSRLAAIDFSHDQDPKETLACVSCLTLARQACCPAASKINRVISLGREISERWLAFTSIVFAPIRLAMKRSRSGLIVRSSVETA